MPSRRRAADSICRELLPWLVKTHQEGGKRKISEEEVIHEGHQGPRRFSFRSRSFTRLHHG